MNLFYLDKDLDKAAQFHVDKHIVKMPLEAAQILCTTIYIDRYCLMYFRKKNKKMILMTLL